MVHRFSSPGGFCISVHLRNRLESETNKRQQAEEWCSMLEKELTAHLAARQIAETKCEKLYQRIKILNRKVRSQQHLLRRKLREVVQQNHKEAKNVEENKHQNSIHSHDEEKEDLLDKEYTNEEVNFNPTEGTEIKESSTTESHDTVQEVTRDLQTTSQNAHVESDSLEEDSDDVEDSFIASHVDDEAHFASDEDETQIVEPTELQVSSFPKFIVSIPTALAAEVIYLVPYVHMYVSVYL